MQELTQSGIRFAMDDFGKGHSSLLLLHDLPISYLKLDRHFVKNLESTPAIRETIKAVTRLCHSLKIQVIAEGIETSAQSQIMADLKVDFLQGYLFDAVTDP